MVMTGERGKGNFFEIIRLKGGEVSGIYFLENRGVGWRPEQRLQIWSGMIRSQLSLVNFSLNH